MVLKVISNSFPLTATCLRSWSKEALVFVFKSASSAEIKQTHGMLTVTNSIYFLNFRTYHKILISWIAKHVQQFCSRVYEISLFKKASENIYRFQYRQRQTLEQILTQHWLIFSFLLSGFTSLWISTFFDCKKSINWSIMDCFM